MEIALSYILALIPTSCITSGDLPKLTRSQSLSVMVKIMPNPRMWWDNACKMSVSELSMEMVSNNPRFFFSSLNSKLTQNTVLSSASEPWKYARWMDSMSTENIVIYRLNVGLPQLAIWKSFNIWAAFNIHEIFTILKSIWHNSSTRQIKKENETQTLKFH